MSGLVDMWTSELSKLKEESQSETLDSHGSSHSEDGSGQGVQEKEKMESHGLAWAFAQFGRVNKHRFLCSEDSVSMLVNCFSP